MIKYAIISFLFMSAAHFLTWFQLNGQFIWGLFKNNPLLVSLFGVPISYLFIKGTEFGVKYFDGSFWPVRFLGFGVGIIIYGIMVSYFFNEGVSIKTFISLVLAVGILLVQFFMR